MNLDRLTKLRKPGLIAAAFVFALAIAVLTIDYVRTATSAERLATQIDETAELARQQADQGEAFLQIAQTQAARSLARDRRQQWAAIAALVSAGLAVGLMKTRQQTKPVLPEYVAGKVLPPQPEPPQAASDEQVAPPPEPDVDLAPLEQIVERVGHEQRHLIPLLHAIDQHYHYLPSSALARLAETTAISRHEIASVASFYSQFRTRPRGEHVVRVCHGTACHVAGAGRIEEQLRRQLGIPAGTDTDPGQQVTVESVGCLGCCTLAPVLEVDGEVEGHTQVESLTNLVDWQRRSHQVSGRGDAALVNGRATTNGKALITAPPTEIRIGVGSCCVASGSRDVLDSLQQAIDTRHLNAVVKPVGCVGACHLTPLVEVATVGAEPIVATRATPGDVPEILRQLPGAGRGSWFSRNRLPDLWQRGTLESVAGENVAGESYCTICPASDLLLRRFVDPQVRIVTEHSGEINPTSLQDYQAREGFVALKRVLEEWQPGQAIDVVEASGLRGRGGGGFPTATKWRKVASQPGEKLLVCNGDEGDPGAFMDRMVMESYPYRVLEGMAIAAYAVGARRAFIYVRHEYPLAVERLRNAIKQLTLAHLLGENILGTDFSLDVELVEGAGAFVCGEETALLQSIMGHRGTPQLRPPYPVERGLFDRPTLVNNVETFANVPWIVRHGADRFAALGTETSKGTKVFSLSGKVRRGGLIEIPMGLTIRQVIQQIGGGVADGRKFKAVQIGGPSGGCIPAQLGDTPIDYESLKAVGAMMGSGGMVVLDDHDCMVDVARYFLEFTQSESCGHCTFCRVGTRKLLDILERLCTGKGKPRDLQEIETLARSIGQGSLCGLGKTAPNPVLSTLQYFRDEYEAHLQGRCPAGRCKSLIRYEVTRDCVGCTLCAQHCPVGAIPATPYRQHVIDSNICTRCDVCRTTCPEDAITVV